MSTSFPLSKEAAAAFEILKKEIELSVLDTIDENGDLELQVETDASDFALSAVLNQNGRPVGFFSRMLNGSELKYSSVEKEAAAIVESIKYWRHFLLGRHFKLLTDQKSVSYMFDQKHHSKIKNDKILRWRIELASFSFDIFFILLWIQ